MKMAAILSDKKSLWRICGAFCEASWGCWRRALQITPESDTALQRGWAHLRRPLCSVDGHLWFQYREAWQSRGNYWMAGNWEGCSSILRASAKVRMVIERLRNLTDLAWHSKRFWIVSLCLCWYGTTSLRGTSEFIPEKLENLCQHISNNLGQV